MYVFQLIAELIEVYKAMQHIGQIRIFGIGLIEKAAQIGNSIRYALHKVRLFFEITSESISAQHLQCTEQHKVAQLLVEILLIDRLVFSQCRDIFVYKVVAQTLRKSGLSLP